MKRKIETLKDFMSSISFFAITLMGVFAIVYVVKYIGYNMEDTKMPIHKVHTEEKKIALSFDIAWGESNIKDILNTLD